MSEILLEREIEECRKNGNQLSMVLCERELAVIKKLKICGIDMTGKTEEFIKRLDEQKIYFMKQDELEEMKEKAHKYDLIYDVTVSIVPNVRFKN